MPILHAWFSHNLAGKTLTWGIFSSCCWMFYAVWQIGLLMCCNWFNITISFFTFLTRYITTLHHESRIFSAMHHPHCCAACKPGVKEGDEHRGNERQNNWKGVKKKQGKRNTQRDARLFCLTELARWDSPYHHIRFSALLPQPYSLASGHVSVWGGGGWDTHCSSLFENTPLPVLV